ncbi:hypothetical protein D5041_11480 [Verminephrobacter aporrectodeae subsp. tuberculatae]|nr:hypothetical protein [Verminephrobacter aporrectodeae subsp. tuberculatae]MCW5289652.1 hypothetical protein [Verminephrobacter aporrectodeae subsp. tuberculatae]MCW8207882.1 hypothetical protein [Verminephrobacter aporrectodeae subsp. tuberculatae]
MQESPFALLAASPRDDRRRIVDLAEEKALEIDHAKCQKARSDLTNPRTRLSAEVAWLPGVSPRRAHALTQALLTDPMAARAEVGLPALAHCNLMAAAFEAVDAQDRPGEIAQFIQEMALRVDELDAEEVLQAVNEDRAVSGFPEVRGTDQVESELAERKRYFRNAIKDALNRLQPDALVQSMTLTVDRATNGGAEHAPELIDEIVDSYAVETQSFLQKEAENVEKLISAMRESAKAGEGAVRPLIDCLNGVIRNWDKVAQPLQVSFKARGMDHDASRDLAYKVRSLAVDLFNEHDLLKQSQRLTSLLKEVFSEIPDIVDRVEEDAQALNDIAQRRNESTLIDPIRKLCESISASVDRNPSLAHHEGQRVLEEGGAILKATLIKTSSPTYQEAQNQMAVTLLHCAVSYGNETSKWAPCMTLLQKALELASDNKLRQKLRENLATVQGNLNSLGDLKPVSSAPELSSINGIGFTLYGSTDQNPFNGSYMVTYYFVFFFVPIFPIARYRVIPTGGGYLFLGKGPLRVFDKWHIAISLCLICWIIMNWWRMLR